MLTIERLRELLQYDPATGRWLRLVDISNQKKGSYAGTVNRDGYWMLAIDGKKYKSSRLAWFYQTGEWPSRTVDHQDTDRANDRWGNLRLATESQNSGNVRVHADNACGFKGVCRTQDSKAKPFKAQIMVSGRKRHLGHFQTAEEAHAAYLNAAQQGFGQFARG